MSEEEAEYSSELIPALVDDVALSCLHRLSLPEQAVARAVSRSWRATISNPHYLRSRVVQGLAEPWLFVSAIRMVGNKLQWQAFDPVRQRYHIIPPMPCKESMYPLAFGCASIPTAGVLLVCGGRRFHAQPPRHHMDTVLKYETFSNRWTLAAQMNTPRAFFASATLDGRVYACCGTDGIPHTRGLGLLSAEVYDPDQDTWSPIASMDADLASYQTAVLDGKVHVIDEWMWPYQTIPDGQMYDPTTDTWEDMRVGMRRGWCGQSFVVHNILFVINDHEWLQFYDGNSDTWKLVGGEPVPPQLQRPFSVNTIDGKVYVVARSLHVAVGTIVDSQGLEVQWEVIVAPKSFADLEPSSSHVLYA